MLKGSEELTQLGGCPYNGDQAGQAQNSPEKEGSSLRKGLWFRSKRRIQHRGTSFLVSILEWFQTYRKLTKYFT